jgi:hypothetical protein
VPDFFTSIGTLLSGSFLQDGALWALRTIPGFPPIIQTVHILGIAVVMGSIVMLDLRILGLAARSQQIPEMTKRLMPWLWWALASNLVSGGFFLLGRPNRYFNNPVFAWKMSFLLPAIALTLLYYLMSRRQDNYWQMNLKRQWMGRAIALLSLSLLILVATSGRWIAYLEYLQFPLWSIEVFDAGPQPSFLLAVENWSLSQNIASTNWFPVLESIHVIAAAMVVGSILMVDLRLIGLAAKKYSISKLSKEMVPWSIAAFVITTITGLGMFITRAASHVVNPAFQWKAFLLLLAGLNMVYFHFRIYKRISEWDTTEDTPTQLKVIGCLSLILWSGVMLAGRWVGHIV